MSQLSLFLVGLTLLALGAFVLRARGDDPVHRWFAAFTCACALWAWAIAATYAFPGTNLPLRLAFGAAGLIPVTFLAFTHAFPVRVSPWVERAIPSLVVFALALGTISAVTPLVVLDVSVDRLGLHRKTGPAYPIFVTYFLLTFLCAAALLVAKWKKATGRTRFQLQYVGLAIIASGLGGITTNLLLPTVTGKSTYSWIGPHFGLPLAGLIAHAIIRHRLMDLRLILHRGLVATLAALLSLIPVIGVLVVLWHHSQSDGLLQSGEILGLLVAAVVVSLIVPPTRDLAERLLDRYVYRTRTSFRTVVLEVSTALTRVLRLDTVLDHVGRVVATSTGPEGAAIYLRSDGQLTLAAPARGIEREPGHFHASKMFPVEVAGVLLERRELLLLGELERESPAPAAVLDAMRSLGWELVLPIRFEDEVIGAVVLGAKRSGDPFYQQDIDLLTTLANQAGIAIRNAQLYTQVVVANEHLTNIVGTIESGVVAIDAGGRVTMFNRAAEQLTGLPAERVQRQPVAALPAPLGTLLAATLADGQGRTQPDLTLSDGAVTRPVLGTTSPLRDPGGAVLGAVAVLSDLTPLRELEAERRRAERFAYFQLLTSSLAHELKNPLVAIKTFAQLIPRRQGDARFIDEFGRIVTREIGRMERLLGRLRAPSPAGQRPAQPLDPRAPLLDALELLRPAFEEKRIRLRLDLGAQALTVLGDQGELEELFVNLLMNAGEATPPDGTVSVEVRAGERAVAVTVADSGPGIAPEMLERIFDPFVTTKQGGRGLGLTICAGIATAHRAKLRAANGPAGGALLTLELPLAAAVPAPVRG